MIPKTLFAFACLALLCGASPPLSFVPVQPRFTGAAEEYREIWAAEGPRIVATMEADTGLAFPATPIDVFIHQGPGSMTSYDGRSIRIRAGYSPDYKRATLIHEMGHRLTLGLPRTAELDDHRILYLFLYDVWTDLYGQDFADRMVKIERRIPSTIYDYDAAWRWALSMTREQRQARLAVLRAMPMRQAATTPTLRYETDRLIDSSPTSPPESAPGHRPGG
jgi:hypothetical protein